MDIKPTLVEVKDIIILDDSNYGDNVLIQVLGYENATSPLSVPYETLLAFANKVQELQLGPPALVEVPIDPVEPAPTQTDITDFVS